MSHLGGQICLQTETADRHFTVHLTPLIYSIACLNDPRKLWKREGRTTERGTDLPSDTPNRHYGGGDDKGVYRRNLTFFPLSLFIGGLRCREGSFLSSLSVLFM